MDKENLTKLKDNLTQRLSEIDKELRSVASENPAVEGDFSVRVDDLGQSQEDAAQEAGELDRNQALVDSLEKEKKSIINTLSKIESGEYGKCEACLSLIQPARLKAMPVATHCIECAQKIRF